MQELIDLSVVKALDCMQRGEFSATELVKAHLERAEHASNLNAFITITSELALDAAAMADERYRTKTNGIIEGIPIGVKDLFCTKGVLTTAGSYILHNFVPPYESTVTSTMLKNGGIMIGKTNMDEFAMGSASINSYYGPVINPHSRNNDDTPLVAGGSSGGSSAAVAAKLCMGALGSDTGGSVRQPAAFCGIVGVKPTYGRCSRYGMIAFASSLDQAGVFAKNVEDTALLLQSICGYDPKDATSRRIDTPNWNKTIKASIKGYRVGIPKEYIVDGMNNDTISLWENGKKWLQAAGAEIVEISLPHTQYALPTYYVIATSEASSNLARYDGIRYGFRSSENMSSSYDMMAQTRAKGFGKEVKRRIMIGTYLLSSRGYNAYYVKAQKVRRLITDDFINAFNNVDVILTPTAPSTAFGVDEKIVDPVTMYLNDIFTVTVNLAGLPGISVPAMFARDGLPMGLQVIGRPFDEETMFRAAWHIEQAAQFNPLHLCKS